MTHHPGSHPNRFAVVCGVDSFHRVVLPGGVIICLSCDRAYANGGHLVGPGNAATAKDIPLAVGAFWNVPRTRG